MDQQEYVKEEIDWSYIEFIDNQDILDLIEKVSTLFFFLVYFIVLIAICELNLVRFFQLYFSVVKFNLV